MSLPETETAASLPTVSDGRCAVDLPRHQQMGNPRRAANRGGRFRGRTFPGGKCRLPPSRHVMFLRRRNTHNRPNTDNHNTVSPNTASLPAPAQLVAAATSLARSGHPAKPHPAKHRLVTPRLPEPRAEAGDGDAGASGLKKSYRSSWWFCWR